MQLTKLMSAAAIVFSMASASVQAAPVQWNFHDVTFQDGSTLTGHFTYDADTNEYLDWSITSSSGWIPSFTYDPSTSLFYMQVSDENTLLVSDLGHDQYLYLNFDFDFTNEGGTSNIMIGDNSYECDNCGTWRYVTAGAVTSVDSEPNTVPEPGSMLLLGTLLAGAAYARRRN